MNVEPKKPNTRTARGRERLLAAAERAFLIKGYQASIDEIVQEAGVVRQTLYNHFGNKDGIFIEVVRRLTSQVLVTLEVDSLDLRTTLVQFGVAVRKATLSDEGISLHRTLVTEAQRFPVLARTFYAEGRDRALERLVDLLSQETQEGRLGADEARFAAEILLVLLVEPDRSKRVFCADDQWVSGNSDVERVVDFFLRAFFAKAQGCKCRLHPT